MDFTKRISKIDAKILRELLKDGRKDFAEIAKELRVSRNTVWKHYEEMKKSGIIIGATTQLSYKDFGMFVVEILAKNFTIKEGQKEYRTRDHARIEYLPEGRGRLEYTPFPNTCTTMLRIKEIDELETAKRSISKEFSSVEIKTLIWTGRIRNIPENLSFGLFNSLSDNFSDKGYVARPQPPTDRVGRKKIIDETDKKIIDKLSKNGRSPFRKIAEEIGVATDTVARRYKRLKKNGILKVVIQTSPRKLGYKANFDCRFKLKRLKNISSIFEALSKIPDVIHITETSGDLDLHCWALIRDLDHFFTIQERIFSIPDLLSVEFELNKAHLDTYPDPEENISRG